MSFVSFGIRVISRLIAFLLIAEALFAALRLATLLPQIGIYDGPVVALIFGRGALGALQFAGGWMLANHRPAGPGLARSALIAGAVLTILDVGLRLALSGVGYWYRWQYSAGYCAYAVAAWGILRSAYRSIDSSVHRSI